MSPARALGHPTVEVEDHEEGLLLRFYAPGSRFGTVEIVLDIAEAHALVESVDQAITFSPLHGDPGAT